MKVGGIARDALMRTTCRMPWHIREPRHVSILVKFMNGTFTSVSHNAEPETPTESIGKPTEGVSSLARQYARVC